MGRKLRELTIKDDFSVGVQGEIRLKPRNFGDFQRYPQSAYVQYASIVCLEKYRNSRGGGLRVEKRQI